MPEVVADFVQQCKIFPAVGCQAFQRKQLKICSSGKEDNQQDGKQKYRNGLADEDNERADNIKFFAVFASLFYAEGDCNQVNDER